MSPSAWASALSPDLAGRDVEPVVGAEREPAAVVDRAGADARDDDRVLGQAVVGEAVARDLVAVSRSSGRGRRSRCRRSPGRSRCRAGRSPSRRTRRRRPRRPARAWSSPAAERRRTRPGRSVTSARPSGSHAIAHGVSRPVATVRTPSLAEEGSSSPPPQPASASRQRRAARRTALACQAMDLTTLARHFRSFGRNVAADSPLYGQLGALVSESPDLLALAAGSSEQTPMVFLAAVHDELLRDPGPRAGGLLPHAGRGRARARPRRRPSPPSAPTAPPRSPPRSPFRRTQTNEVARCGCLLPAFAAVADGRPLALIEIGASAGLNLRWDHYAYDYGGRAAGVPSSPLTIELRAGRPARPAARPAAGGVAGRRRPRAGRRLRSRRRALAARLPLARPAGSPGAARGGARDRARAPRRHPPRRRAQPRCRG